MKLLTHDVDQKITNGSLESYNQYIRYERRAKYPDLFVTRGVFERAIAEAAKSRFVGNEGAEEALRMFWINYCDSLVRVALFDVASDLWINAYYSVH